MPEPDSEPQVVCEGNVLIESGAGTTVIRKQFAKDLGLTGKKKQIGLAVVGGEKIKQPHSRRVNFWISALKGDQEFKIEGHEVEKTIVNVRALDRKLWKAIAVLSDQTSFHLVFLSSYVVFLTLHVAL